MQSVGEYFKSGRRAKGLNITELEELTHIKKSFLKNIEKADWTNLPEYPVLFGFIKNISTALGLDQQKAVALFRRDYPPSGLGQAVPPPAQEIKKEFRLSPRLTFFGVILIIALTIGGYLVSQYLSFISPPPLEVYEPTQNQIVTKSELIVSGKTNPDVVIEVNNQPVLVAEDGTFETTLDVFTGTVDISFEATSRSGKQTVIHRTIKPQLENN